MKKMYHVIVETMDGSAKYETTVNSKYEVKEARDRICEVKPDTVIMIGDDLAIRAGEVKAIMIDGECVDVEEVKDGTL